jgi:type IV pilus assembly protein PilE
VKEMKHTNDRRGFTLIELMIVVAVVAILVALALPSYTGYIRKANRGEAQQLLLNWANNQEIWRANAPEYATAAQLGAPSHDKYEFAPSNLTATTYTLTATAKTADQLKDKERGTMCSPMILDQANAKAPPDCW